MKIVLLLFAIISLFFILSYNSVAQNNPCYAYYDFEFSKSTPSKINDWSSASDQSHTGNKSFMVHRSDGKIRSFHLLVPGNKDEPVEVSFWYLANKSQQNGKSGQLLMDFDGKREFLDYTNWGGWQQFIKTVSGSSQHDFTWTFFPAEDASCWIDDLCIRNESCNVECPEVVPREKTPEPTTTEPTTTEPTTTEPTTTEPTTTEPTTTEPTTTEPTTTEPTTNGKTPCGITLSNVENMGLLVEKGIDRHPSIFPTIQSAVNFAPPGSVIKVMNMSGMGPYEEVVKINKSLTLFSDDNATIQTPGIAALFLEADDVNVCGIKIKRGSTRKEGVSGIQVINAKRCNLSGITIEGCDFGIYLENVHDSKIKNNILSDLSEEALRLVSSKDNEIISNIIDRVAKFGITLDYSSRNTITKNTLSNTRDYGVYINKSNENIIKENIYCGDHKNKVLEVDSKSNDIDLTHKELFRTSEPCDECYVYD